MHGCYKMQNKSSARLKNFRYIMWRFPKVTGTVLGVPMTRIIYWDLDWGPLTLGNHHVSPEADTR